MLLTITNRTAPAADLGYLLAKHPDRAQSFGLPFGQAHVVYPEVGDACTTCALVIEVDPVGLVRKHQREFRTVFQYVNDRPHVASSLLSSALSTVFGSALNGRCTHDPTLAERTLDLEAELPVVPSRGGEALIRRLFEPLGYMVEAERLPLDERFPEWGESALFRLKLSGALTLRELLRHLYVLLPVLDDSKHYWVGESEVDKLLEKGDDWLSDHPDRELVVQRYLRRQPRLMKDALARLTETEEPGLEAADDAAAAGEERIEKPLSLNDRRLDAVVERLVASGARTVIDLGCGEGKLVRRLLAEAGADGPRFEKVVGMDVSHVALQRCQKRLYWDRMGDRERARIDLIQGSLTYRDRRLSGFDAAALVEVIEHLDLPRLEALERTVFGDARPGTVVLTTPNAEYNVLFEGMAPGAMRHRDHRFEWTRPEFESWARGVAERHGYAVVFHPVGDVDEAHGAPTQMGVFTR